MSSGSRLTTTSYAILGLLAIRSWSTYELTKQMDRSLGRIWPRATSKLYEEPKKLVEHGYATARSDRVGNRPRTVYAITAKGRRALSAWLSEPASGPALESEQVLKLFFADQGTRDDALATVAAARSWAEERNADNRAVGEAYLAGQAPFQDRLATNVIAARFLTDFYRMVAEWADWAAEVIERWPDDPSAAAPDMEIVRETVRRAAW
jgi:PadR family transcriptional regulator, regulatory protein AphA